MCVQKKYIYNRFRGIKELLLTKRFASKYHFWILIEAGVRRTFYVIADWDQVLSDQSELRNMQISNKESAIGFFVLDFRQSVSLIFA